MSEKKEEIVKVQFIQDFGESKKGDILSSKKRDAEKFVKENLVIILDKKETERADEAKFLRDKSVLETGKNSQLSMVGAISSLNVTPENYERIVEKKYNLKDVYKVYKRYFNVEDTNRIDVVLAVALSRKLDGIPLWLILVGPSGDMKSVQLNSFDNENVYILHNLTSKTLVNGYKNKEEHPDLAPELDNKLIIIPDMAQVLKLPPSEKGELWGQLRDLYDGLAGKVSGMGSRARYSNLHITLLAGSTPAIDGQILVHQDLGTRELIYRTFGNNDKRKSMMQCFENEEMETEIKNELKEITQNFINNKEIKREKISSEIENKLMEISTYITYMRATADIDSYTNELRNLVYPEEPTRIAKQMKRLFVCLKSLDEDYPDSRAFEILWHIAKSSAFPIRVNIYEYLIKQEGEFSTSQISEKFHIGKKTAQRELAILWNMNLVNCRKEVINSQYPDRTYDYWNINKRHEFNKNTLRKLK